MIFLALAAFSCSIAVPISRGTLQGAELGLTGVFLISRTRVLSNSCVPRDGCDGRSRTPICSARAGAEQVKVALRAAIIDKAHEESPLRSGTSDPSTLSQLIAASHHKPLGYKGVLLSLVA